MKLRCPICNAHTKYTGVIFSEEKHLEAIHFKSFKTSYPDYQPTNYRIYKCKSCKHQFCQPMPSEDYLDVVYGQHFYDNYFGGIGYPKAFEEFLKHDFELKVALVHKLCLENGWAPSEVSVLEIGSGPGYFAKMLQQSGIACMPVDANQEAVILGQEIGIEVLDCDLRAKDNPLSNNKYDIVISWATIEHIPDVQNFLELVSRYVKKGGLFLCDTGNANDPYLISDTGYTNWIYPPMHVHYFSTKSLRKCLEKTGFNPLRIYPRSEILYDQRTPEKIDEFVAFMRYCTQNWREIFKNILNPTAVKEYPGQYASTMLSISKKGK